MLPIVSFQKNICSFDFDQRSRFIWIQFFFCLEWFLIKKNGEMLPIFFKKSVHLTLAPKSRLVSIQKCCWNVFLIKKEGGNAAHFFQKQNPFICLWAQNQEFRNFLSPKMLLEWICEKKGKCCPFFPKKSVHLTLAQKARYFWIKKCCRNEILIKKGGEMLPIFLKNLFIWLWPPISRIFWIQKCFWNEWLIKRRGTCCPFSSENILFIWIWPKKQEFFESKDVSGFLMKRGKCCQFFSKKLVHLALAPNQDCFDAKKFSGMFYW